MNGGAGVDTISGGGGNDYFVFSAPLAPAYYQEPLPYPVVVRGGRVTPLPPTFDPTPAVPSLNRDVIIDFTNGSGNNDAFKLENAVMAALGGPGNLNPLYFHNGTQATNSNHHIIYNQSTGVSFTIPTNLHRVARFRSLHCPTMSR